MITSETILFDTNILVYNQDKDSKFYPQASSYHQQAISGKLRASVSDQNLTEFLAVITNPKRVVHPLTQKKAVTEAEKYIQSGLFEIIRPVEETIQTFFHLLDKIQLKDSRQVFDVFLVATMVTNGITRILTENYQDFSLFKEIKVIRLSD